MKKIIYKAISKIFFFLERISYEYKYEYEYRKKYNLDKSFRFNGKNILMYGDGEICINKNSYIGSNSSLQAYKNTRITIGSNCSISHYFVIYTANKNAKNIINEDKLTKVISGDVYIGDNSWIGHNVFVKEGVSIGRNCVIGSHSVVISNIPDNSIAVGSPARVVSNKV